MRLTHSPDRSPSKLNFSSISMNDFLAAFSITVTHSSDFSPNILIFSSTSTFALTIVFLMLSTADIAIFFRRRRLFDLHSRNLPLMVEIYKFKHKIVLEVVMAHPKISVNYWHNKNYNTITSSRVEDNSSAQDLLCNSCSLP